MYMKRQHLFLMILGCAVPIIVLTAVIVFQMQLSRFLLFGLVLLCPIAHLLMLRYHGGHPHQEQ
jgi:hypothetical protein